MPRCPPCAGLACAPYWSPAPSPAPRPPSPPERVVAANSISRELIAGLYHVADADILELVAFDPAAAIKITMRRLRTSGDIGETDVYGAQQHAPLLALMIELSAGAVSQ